MDNNNQIVFGFSEISGNLQRWQRLFTGKWIVSFFNASPSYHGQPLTISKKYSLQTTRSHLSTIPPSSTKTLHNDKKATLRLLLLTIALLAMSSVNASIISDKRIIERRLEKSKGDKSNKSYKSDKKVNSPAPTMAPTDQPTIW